MTVSTTGHTGQAGDLVSVVVVQALSVVRSALSATRVKIRAEEKTEGSAMDAGLLLILLEAVLALGLFVFIIWWTLPKKGKSDKK